MKVLLWVAWTLCGSVLYAQNLSGLKTASVVSVADYNGFIHLTVSVTDTAGHTTRRNEWLNDAERMLWVTDPKAVITLAYLRAAQQLADDVAAPIPGVAPIPTVSLAEAIPYLATAQAELNALTPR